MNLRNKALIGISLFAAACGSESDSNTPSTKTGTVVGRLEAGGSGSASSASAFRLGDDGSLTLAGSGAVAGDGSFRIDGVEGDGPFIVQLIGSGSGEGSVLGEVIVPEDMDGDEVRTLLVSGETTAEAEALVELVRGDTDADPDEVDTIALMSWVDGELAAHSDSGHLVAAFASAQEGWLRVTGEGAAAVEEAKLEAWAELTAALDDAQNTDEAEQAWSDFHARVAGDVAAALDVSESEQANAQAAASVLFEAAFEGASSESQEAAARVAATLSAHADFAAQGQALQGFGDELEVQLSAAYEAFFGAIEDADTEEQMSSAWVELSGEITAIVERTDASEEDLDAAFTAAAEANASLEAKLEAAFASGEDQAEAVATAYGEFRADIEAAFAAFEGDFGAFASEAASQLAGHGSVILDIDLGDIFDIFAPNDPNDPNDPDDPEDPIDIGLDIVGSFTGGFSGTLDAVLVSIDGDGMITIVAEGAASNGTYTFEGVTETSGTLVVELRDGGDVVAAAVLDTITQAEGRIDGASITSETTAEAQILIERIEDGEDQIDFSAIEARIDAAIAAAATDGEGDSADIDALATATLAAEHTRAGLSATFALVVEAIRGEGSAVAEASEARARTDAALALDAAVQSAFDGSSFEGRATEIHAAVMGFVSASDEAEGGAELDAAAEAFVDAVLSIQDEMSGDDLGLDIVSQGVIATAYESSFVAGGVFEGALSAAFAASGSGNWSGFESATGAAEATFEGSLAGALSLSSLTLTEADHEAIGTLAAHLATSFSGSFDGSFED